jgi:hypothetical protein
MKEWTSLTFASPLLILMVVDKMCESHTVLIQRPCCCQREKVFITLQSLFWCDRGCEFVKQELFLM